MVAEVGERLVHVDPQGLGEVLAVVVLAVGGLEPLDAVVGNVAPPPQERGEVDPLASGSSPDWLHVVLQQNK